MSPTLSNILMITEGQVGDLLLLTPAIRGVKGRFPGARLCLLIVDRRGAGGGDLLGPAGDRVVSGNPAIAEAFSIRRDVLTGLSGFRRIRAEVRILKFLRRQSFDAVLCMFPQDRFALWALGSGARRRVGEGKGLARVAFTDSPSVKKGEGSVARYYAAIAECLCGPIPELPTVFFPDREGERWAEQFLEDRKITGRRFVVIHPGATGVYKIWPPERFADLGVRLASLAGGKVVVCGGPADESLVREIVGRSEGQLISSVESRIDRFGSLLRRSRLLISNDSGPRHLGVAVGTPTLCLFRTHHDREWGIYPESDTVRVIRGGLHCPLCPAGQCLDRIPGDERYGSSCLRSISVGQVLETALEMLYRTSTSTA